MISSHDLDVGRDAFLQDRRQVIPGVEFVRIEPDWRAGYWEIVPVPCSAVMRKLVVHHLEREMRSEMTREHGLSFAANTMLGGYVKILIEHQANLWMELERITQDNFTHDADDGWVEATFRLDLT